MKKLLLITPLILMSSSLFPMEGAKTASENIWVLKDTQIVHDEIEKAYMTKPYTSGYSAYDRIKALIPEFFSQDSIIELQKKSPKMFKEVLSEKLEENLKKNQLYFRNLKELYDGIFNYALYQQNNKALQLILSLNEVDPSMKDFSEWNPMESPLLVMVEKSNVQGVSLLIHAGADVNFSGDSSLSPLCLAVQKGNSEVIALLQEAGAKEN